MEPCGAAALPGEARNCRKSAMTRPSTSAAVAPCDRLACPPAEPAGAGVPNEPLSRVVPACAWTRTEEAVLVTLPDCCPFRAIEQPHISQVNAIKRKHRMIQRPS